MGHTCGEPNEIELAAAHVLLYRYLAGQHARALEQREQGVRVRRPLLRRQGTRREPFNSTPMGVNPISSGSPHVRPMGRTCGEPDEIKKHTHPKHFTALFREQGFFGQLTILPLLVLATEVAPKAVSGAA